MAPPAATSAMRPSTTAGATRPEKSHRGSTRFLVFRAQSSTVSRRLPERWDTAFLASAPAPQKPRQTAATEGRQAQSCEFRCLASSPLPASGIHRSEHTADSRQASNSPVLILSARRGGILKGRLSKCFMHLRIPTLRADLVARICYFCSGERSEWKRE